MAKLTSQTDIREDSLRVRRELIRRNQSHKGYEVYGPDTVVNYPKLEYERRHEEILRTAQREREEGSPESTVRLSLSARQLQALYSETFSLGASRMFDYLHSSTFAKLACGTQEERSFVQSTLFKGSQLTRTNLAMYYAVLNRYERSFDGLAQQMSSAMPHLLDGIRQGIEELAIRHDFVHSVDLETLKNYREMIKIVITDPILQSIFSSGELDPQTLLATFEYTDPLRVRTIIHEIVHMFSGMLYTSKQPLESPNSDPSFTPVKLGLRFSGKAKLSKWLDEGVTEMVTLKVLDFFRRDLLRGKESYVQKAMSESGLAFSLEAENIYSSERAHIYDASTAGRFVIPLQLLYSAYFEDFSAAGYDRTGIELPQFEKLSRALRKANPQDALISELSLLSR